MAEYEFLTDDDQAKVYREVKASVPAPDSGQRAREREHFRAVLLAKAGLGEMPDPLGPDESPDVAIREAFHTALEVAKKELPADVQTAIAAKDAEAVAVVAVEVKP